MPVPVMVNLPRGCGRAVVPVMPAAVIAAFTAVAYAATVSPAVTVGAVMVAEPLAVGPVIVRFVRWITVPSVAPLDPKL
jgi:hypothetical protein